MAGSMLIGRYALGRPGSSPGFLSSITLTVFQQSGSSLLPAPASSSPGVFHRLLQPSWCSFFRRHRRHRLRWWRRWGRYLLLLRFLPLRGPRNGRIRVPWWIASVGLPLPCRSACRWLVPCFYISSWPCDRVCPKGRSPVSCSILPKLFLLLRAISFFNCLRHRRCVLMILCLLTWHNSTIENLPSPPSIEVLDTDAWAKVRFPDKVPAEVLDAHWHHHSSGQGGVPCCTFMVYGQVSWNVSWRFVWWFWFYLTIVPLFIYVCICVNMPRSIPSN